ncbi:MAG TPA: ABC-F family ATP-binding cassette domain-containing protein [Enteractinococcus sp.]
MSHSRTVFSHLRVDGLSKSFADRRVFTDISFAVASDDCVGVIGENGAGKSTLLRILAGHEPADAGQVELFSQDAAHPTVGLLSQQPSFAASETLGDVLETAVAPLRAAIREVDDAAQALAEHPHHEAAMVRYTEALDRAERFAAWDVDAHVHRMVAGLGLAKVEVSTPVVQLSGGQTARLALASVLLSAPDVLLLDEPTNHLDDHGVEFLSGLVSTWRGPVLLASHDRAFLDHTVRSLLDLDPAPQPHRLHEAQEPLVTRGITRFTGTYSDYVQYRRDARRRWQDQYDHEQAQLRRLRAAVDEHQVVGHTDWKPRTEIRMAQKYYADRNAKVVARRVNDARARLEELQQRQIVKPPRQLSFQGLDAAHPAGSDAVPDEEVLRATQVASTHRLAPTSMTITATDRLLITGPNGVGKSTLLAMLAGHLAPDHGSIMRKPGLTVGLLPQESDFSAFAGQTVHTVYEQSVGLAVAEATSLATFGLLHPRDHNRPVDSLSVGQQRRLDLAILLATPPEVLMLDEPTNHFSLPLVTDLESSIAHYPGAVIVVSHDRWLRTHWTGRTQHLATSAGAED